jgi:uncharacterized membrane protein
MNTVHWAIVISGFSVSTLRSSEEKEPTAKVSPTVSLPSTKLKIPANVNLIGVIMVSPSVLYLLYTEIPESMPENGNMGTSRKSC